MSGHLLKPSGWSIGWKITCLGLVTIRIGMDWDCCNSSFIMHRWRLGCWRLPWTSQSPVGIKFPLWFSKLMMVLEPHRMFCIHNFSKPWWQFIQASRQPWHQWREGSNVTCPMERTFLQLSFFFVSVFLCLYFFLYSQSGEYYYPCNCVYHKVISGCITCWVHYNHTAHIEVREMRGFWPAHWEFLNKLCMSCLCCTILIMLLSCTVLCVV